MTSSVENRGGQVNMDKFLEHSYHPTGSILRLQDHTEFYAVGNPRSKNGVVMIPDTMGWNSGRIRNIADFFGENGFFVVIPKLSGSTTEGENKGPSIFEASGIGEYMKGLTFNANLKPKINSLTNFLKDEGIEKISLIGFSWGGWVVANVLADPELSSKFVCAALPHPSINLEERMFGGSLPDLFSRVERPILLLPAKGDPEEYNAYVKLMRYKLPSSDVISSYRNLEHGFLLRGRIEDREIQEGVKQCVQQILSYFQYHTQAKLNDFVREAVTGSVLGGKSEAGGGGRHSPVSGGAPSVGQQTQDTWSRWSQQASDTMNRWTQSIQDTTGYYQQQAADTVQRTQEEARQLGEQVQEGYEQTKEKLGEYGQQVQDTTSQLAERAKENIHVGQERAKEGYEQTKEKLGEYGEQVQQGTQQTYEKGKEKAGEYGQRAQEGWDQTKQQTAETFEKGKEKAGEYGQRGQEGWDQTKQQTAETRAQATQKGRETGQQVKDTARQTGQKVGEAMKEGGEKLKEKSGSPKTSPKESPMQHEHKQVQEQTHRR